MKITPTPLLDAARTGRASAATTNTSPAGPPSSQRKHKQRNEKPEKKSELAFNFNQGRGSSGKFEPTFHEWLATMRREGKKIPAVFKLIGISSQLCTVRDGKLLR